MRPLSVQIKLNEQEKLQECVLIIVTDLFIAKIWIERICWKKKDDYTNLRKNLILYKDLVKEMRDKNSLLQKFLDITKNELKQINEKISIEQMTYADVVSQDKRFVSYEPSAFTQAKKHDMKKNATYIVVVNRLLNDIILPVGKINGNKNCYNVRFLY